MAAAPAGRAGGGAGGAGRRGRDRDRDRANEPLPLLPTEAETRQRLLRTVKKEVGAGPRRPPSPSSPPPPLGSLWRLGDPPRPAVMGV